MEQVIITALTIIGSVIASSGFWGFLQTHRKKKDVTTELLMGIAHDRIIYLGMSYVRRGWLTQDEYENLNNYLYIPYKKLGGNGTGERVMKEVEKLEIRDSFSFVLDEIEEAKRDEEARQAMVSGSIRTSN